MRLLLDEHFSPEIARQLRERREHDVQSVSGDARLETMSDADLLAYALREDRVLVTENVVDLMPLHVQVLGSGGHHNGMIFTNPHRFSRSKAAFGVLVNALDEYLRRFDGGPSLKDGVHWL